MLTVTIAHVGGSANSDLKGAGAVRTSFGLGNKSNRTAIIFVSQSGFHFRVTRFGCDFCPRDLPALVALGATIA